MADLPESPQWDAGIYQIELTDPVEGGPDGINNRAAKNLANRTAWLKTQVESAQGGLTAHEAAADPHPQYMTAAETAAVIATSSQPLDATLTALAGVATVADRVIYATAPDAFATAPLTAFARSLLAATDAAAIHALIGDAVPVGTLAFFARSSAPTGYVKANGALLSRAAYPALWAEAQASGNLSASDAGWQAGQYSPGDGSTTFRVPDARGEFVRGWDDGRGVDTGRAIGSAQGGLSNSVDGIRSSYNLRNGIYEEYPLPLSGWSAGIESYRTVNDTSLQVHKSGSETRPRNVALLACIKY